MSHLKKSHTIANSFISSALWNAVLLGLGWFIRDNWHVIGGYLSAYGKVILVCIGAFIFGRFIWSKVKVNKESKVS